MKKILRIALFIAFSLALTSCRLDFDAASDEGAPGSDFKMTALITEIGEKITVDVTKSEYTSGILLVITGDKTEYFDKAGNKISRADLTVGSTVEILYSGQVMMSYPAQIVAARITVI